MEWFFPWTSASANLFNAILLSADEAKVLGVGETVALTRFLRAGIKILHVWETLRLLDLLGVSDDVIT
eukprot:1290194-Rhodomonas_salina.1